jgi:predicted GTPase
MKEYSPEKVNEEVRRMVEAQKVPNILICGQTGVGKSSVVNYLFNESVAMSGENGEPCTRGITLFKNNTVNIYDSKDYEIGGASQAHYERLIFDDFLARRKGAMTVVEMRIKVQVCRILIPMETAAREIGTLIIGEVPSCSLVQDAECEGKTVVEKFPSREMSGIYRNLAYLLTGERRAAS